MATTNFHYFDIAFADASPDTASAEEDRTGHVGRFFRIEEEDPGSWKLWENGQPIVLAPAHQPELAQLLQALRPLPDQDVEAELPGCDGTWYTVSVRTGQVRQGYRWWGSPPPGWSVLGDVADRVRQLADIPRQKLAEENREVVRRYFANLAAGDVEGALELCEAGIIYSNPFFEGQHEKQGAQAVELMWRSWLRARPSVRIVCDDIRSGHAHAFAYWSASLSGELSWEQKFSADLTLSGGKITRHRDRFSLHEWASRTYGPMGSVLGGKTAFQKWAAARERARLAAFESAPST